MSAGIRIPSEPGPAGWNALLGAPAPAEPLACATTADVLIIGAGFAGLTAARRLVQLDPMARIVVLEARRVSEGPAGRNSGFMIDLPHDLASDGYAGALDADRLQTTDNRRAIAFAADMAQEFGISSEGFDLAGKLNGAITEKGDRHNRSFAAHLQRLGEAYEIYDAERMRDITGISAYRSGLFTPGTAILQPALYVRSVAEGLKKLGVVLHENSPVTGLSRKDDWVAKTPKGQVTAPKVILAVNGMLERFGYGVGRLMHVFTYASMTRALSPAEVSALGGAPNWGITPADPMGTTVRRVCGTGGDRIVVRNRFTFDPSLEVSDTRLVGVGKDHNQSFAKRFPMLKDISMEYRWGGRLCLSYNNVQMISELEPGLWSACVQNGLGTAKGTLAGILAAEGVMGHGSEALQRALNAPAPVRLPPRPIAQLGAAARLRWSEWRAGDEM